MNNFIDEDKLIKFLPQYKQEMIENTLTDITFSFTHEIRELVTSETLRVFKSRAERRDFFDQNTSPRSLFNVTEEMITQESSILSGLYYDQSILRIIGLICDEKISVVPFAGERYIINGLTQCQDTQGWHWDDYAYALVFVAKAPLKKYGGLLEYVPNIWLDEGKPDINYILATQKIYKQWFPPQHIYLMRSDKTLHRVSNIKQNVERIAFITAYRNDTDLFKKLDHYSTLQLAGRA